MKRTIIMNGRHLVWGICFLLLGASVYILFRNPYELLFSSWIGLDLETTVEPLIIAGSNNIFVGSLPTFFHVIAVSYLTFGLLNIPRRLQLWIPLLWFLINTIFESFQLIEQPWIDPDDEVKLKLFGWFQNYFVSGVFDWNDILFGLLGALVVSCHLIISQRNVSEKNNYSKHKSIPRTLLYTSIGIISLGSIMGTSLIECTHDDSHLCYSHTRYEPTYLSYSELRTSINTETDKALSNTGKIYVYKDYLFVNSINNGIFIYDNTDPTDPMFVVFINIPGNIDLAIKNDTLYVDSYIDLVVIDISNLQNIQEVDRIENVFQYDQYQNVPHNIYLGYVDSSKGVVIGYKEKQKDE